MKTLQGEFYIKTFGCQMNKNDGAIITALLEEKGYTETLDPDSADIFIVNTCSVRAHAEQRAMGYIATLKTWHREGGRILVVVGCMAQRLSTDLVSRFPHVDIVLGPDEYRSIADAVAAVRKARTKIVSTRLGKETYSGIHPARTGVTDYVSIMRGCDNYCSYCIVPFVRGRSRSRPVSDITDEIRSMIDNGVKDITLLGQNVNEYQHGSVGFADLLRMVADLPGIERVRFLTSHPKDLDEDTLHAVKTNRALCEWFHLPLQSGNNRVLSLMNRQYTKENYLDLIQTIRTDIPDAGITTDILVGFPSETEDEFQDTLAVVRQVKFNDAYMYGYSPRAGTRAYTYDGLPENIVQRRLRELIELQGRIITEHIQNMVGKTYEILFESTAKQGAARGKTRGYRDVIVGQGVTPGSVHQVRISRVKGRTPIGEIVS
jgi:tRNA-2-methylthio-N6-dimethylallyladenosine synthase